MRQFKHLRGGAPDLEEGRAEFDFPFYTWMWFGYFSVQRNGKHLK